MGPIWITIYKANALTLESYRHDRVLFGGDAAHLVPIFGVRGANSGIDDADNLAWKLAFVVQGLASEGLLDSYSSSASLPPTKTSVTAPRVPSSWRRRRSPSS